MILSNTNVIFFYFPMRWNYFSVAKLKYQFRVLSVCCMSYESHKPVKNMSGSYITPKSLGSSKLFFCLKKIMPVLHMHANLSL